MTKRRDVLRGVGATGTLTAMAGCLGWITGGGESGGDGDDETSDGDEGGQDSNEQPENENENTDGKTNSDEAADPGGDTNENKTNSSAENDTGGDGNEGDPENETEAQEQEEQEPLTPDENETEVNKEQYEQQEEREIVELPEDTVEVKLQADQIAESESSPGGLRIYGSVTNTSEQYVDTVDLDISIYDEAGEYVGADIVSVSDLDPEESTDVDRQISAYDLQGQPTSVEVDVMVYGPE